MNPVGLIVASKLHLGSTCLLEGSQTNLIFRETCPALLEHLKSLSKTIDSYFMRLCSKQCKCDHLLIQSGT